MHGMPQRIYAVVNKAFCMKKVVDQWLCIAEEFQKLVYSVLAIVRTVSMWSVFHFRAEWFLGQPSWKHLHCIHYKLRLMGVLKHPEHPHWLRQWCKLCLQLAVPFPVLFCPFVFAPVVLASHISPAESTRGISTTSKEESSRLMHCTHLFCFVNFHSHFVNVAVVLLSQCFNLHVYTCTCTCNSQYCTHLLVYLVGECMYTC